MSDRQRYKPFFEFNILDRESLQELRYRAEEMSKTHNLSSGWARAYENLADAADRLDAMEARTEVRHPFEEV